MGKASLNFPYRIDFYLIWVMYVRFSRLPIQMVLTSSCNIKRVNYDKGNGLFFLTFYENLAGI